jgi:phosphate/sulfate permease
VNSIPFGVYDFFAYLSSGSVLILTADYVFGAGLLERNRISSVLAVWLVVAAYICGHIVAQCSAFVYERLAVERVLRSPVNVLLGSRPTSKLLRTTFPNYFRMLPEHTQERVRERAAARNFSGTGEALFLHAYAIVTSDARFQDRLDSFRNQYGFARNVSFALLIAAVTIFIAQSLGQPVQDRWAIIAAVASVCLFYRYLKFFRQFSYELLLRYAEITAS